MDIEFSVKMWTRDDGATCFTATPKRRGGRKETPHEKKRVSTMPTAYTLVKRGKSFSTVDKGYRALVRDYPERWRDVTEQCLKLMRDVRRTDNERRLREQQVKVDEISSIAAFKVDGITLLRMRNKGASATFSALVPIGDSDSFSHIFTFLISKGRVMETAEVKSFLRKFPVNGWAMIGWMERSVTDGEK